MNETTTKLVLIADDEESIRDIERDGFIQSNERRDCPYDFEIDLVGSVAECFQSIRNKTYDVIVLDMRMEEETSGIQAAFALHEQLGVGMPIRIIVTGFPSYPQCVQAMRYGVWDYIVKMDAHGVGIARRLVESAVCRLRQIDLRQKHEQEIGAKWLPANFLSLRERYSGQIVAIWHKPQVGVVANGRDAFELEEKLATWRGAHAVWEQPYVVEMPLASQEDKA